MKVKLLKKLRKTTYIEYDSFYKEYKVSYRLGSFPCAHRFKDKEFAYEFYRDRLISEGYNYFPFKRKAKLTRIQHAVK